MVDPERVIRDLACLIDPDEPPGLAANALARAVVALVRDRGGLQATLMEPAIHAIAFDPRFARGDEGP
jgi:hypothetical protein